MPLRVLVVEDDPPSLELIQAVLASVGIQAMALGDSEQAAALLEQETFDGIFLDWQMPKLDGLQLLRLIRKSSLNRKALIVMITASTDPKVTQQAFAAGANYFLGKPLDKIRILQLLRSARSEMERRAQAGA